MFEISDFKRIEFYFEIYPDVVALQQHIDVEKPSSVERSGGVVLVFNLMRFTSANIGKPSNLNRYLLIMMVKVTGVDSIRNRH